MPPPSKKENKALSLCCLKDVAKQLGLDASKVPMGTLRSSWVKALLEHIGEEEWYSASEDETKRKTIQKKDDSSSDVDEDSSENDLAKDKPTVPN